MGQHFEYRELNESIIRGLILHAFDTHTSGTTVKAGGCVMYDYLFRHGIIKPNREEIESAKLDASEALGNRALTETTVNLYAKALLVDAFFLNVKLGGEHINDYLDGPRYALNPETNAKPGGPNSKKHR